MKKYSTIYINGQFVQVDSKILTAFTPGVFQGQGVFETLLAVGREVFDVPAHLKRLRKGLKEVKVSGAIIRQVVKLNGFDVSRVRIVAWKTHGCVHFIVTALKFSFPVEKEYKVCLVKTHRPATSRGADIKSLDYKIFADAYNKASAQGFDEALLMNNKGDVFEASRANVFWFKGDTLFTPPLSSGCLNGITRTKVIKYARQLRIPFKEKNLSMKELNAADKVFLTNSLIGIKGIKKFFPLLPR